LLEKLVIALRDGFLFAEYHGIKMRLG